MDIYCPVCGEPWEIDSLHNQITENGLDYDEFKLKYPDSNERQRVYEAKYFNPIMKKFRTEGCGVVFDVGFCKEKKTGVTAASIAAFEIMGDDIDGVASMMEDAEMMGMFDE